jgi:hypothetical protein
LLAPLAWPPPVATDTRVVVLSTRSCRNASLRPFVSPETRSAARDVNATKRPLPETAGGLKPLPPDCTPPEATETRVVLGWTMETCARATGAATAKAKNATATVT